MPTLVALYNASWELGHHPNAFRESTTVVLRKPAKADYSLPNSYRPIALLNTLGKTMEKIIATRINHAVETESLLPRLHIGGRRARSPEHALHLLLEAIHAAWLNNEVATVLMLDISGAYDNVSHERLLHNLRKRRIGGNIAKWIESFLQERKTTIAMPDYTSQPFTTNVGVPQGSPISPILYLFYNADLMEEEGPKKMNLGYVDDISKLIIGTSAEQNCRNLEASFMTREQKWADTHASKFAPAIFQLLHFIKGPSETDLNPPERAISLAGKTIKPQHTATYLGATFDDKLKWQAHLRKLEAKTSKRLGALGSLAGSTWGTSLASLRRIYQATILPQLTFGCSAWYVPEGGYGTITQATAVLKAVRSIQRRAALIISGAFRTTSGPALDMELHLLLGRQRMEQAVNESLLRIRSSPLYAIIREIRAWTSQADSHYRYWSPLAKLESRLMTSGKCPQPWRLEVILPFIVEPWWSPPETHIASSKEEAIKVHDKMTSEPNQIVIYTDGSDNPFGVGAAAVIPSDNTRVGTRLGTNKEATVYLAELVGIDLGLAAAIARWQGEIITVFADNQSAIKSVADPGTQSGQFILREIIGKLHACREMQARVRLCWIPGHMGVEGNEIADQAAKEASGWLEPGQSPSITHFDFLGHTVKSAIKRNMRTMISKEWAGDWEAEKRGQMTKKLLPQPTNKVLQLYQGLHKSMSSTLVQMRTGKIGLRKYLSDIGRTETGECPCGFGYQTVHHVLLECVRHHRLRMETIWIGRKVFDLQEIFSTPRLAKAASKFMLSSRLLGQFGDVRIATEQSTS